ncbi:MAG: thiolase family protein [Deltaproteobacteria bacterium]|nr:thiolase family protein [Deltaproteobacteria bacterium]
MFTKTYVPYRGYFCTPFCRWQGSFQTENAIELGAMVTKKGLAERSIDPKQFDGLFLGYTIPQISCFFGGPWMAGMIGAETISGPILSQACATSATLVGQATMALEADMYGSIVGIATDRTSNGPHLVYPNPNGPGGMPIKEDWVMDNFNNDPWAKNSMIQTAENVAKEKGITREDCDVLVLKRYLQYLDALKDDRAFQKRYMMPVEIRKGKQTVIVDQDEGIIESTEEGLARLKPFLPGGAHTFAAQTHPADGNATIILAHRDKAKSMSADPAIEIQVLSYGYARAAKGYLAKAVPPAARMALEKAGIKVSELAAVKTHNPFAGNDVHMIREMNMDPEIVNNYGSSLIYGHPQAPTGLRLIIELIEELVLLGGGYGLFVGCSAGDTAASVTVKVG